MAPRSIQATPKPNMISAQCRVFRHAFDGNVYEERLEDSRKKVWVARLECKSCGTRRIDVMVPSTCELISRHYDYSNAEGYNTKLPHPDARRYLFKVMFDKTREEEKEVPFSETETA